MNSNAVITIARQFGSGGREIGERLAEKMEIPFYDKSLIHLAAKESGINEDLFDYADENSNHGFWTASAGNTAFYGNRISLFNEMPMNDKLFLIQSNMIRKLASGGPCVIVGRCADYILRGHDNLVTVFIHANDKDRLRRVVSSYGVEEKDAIEVMTKTDKKRAAYYNYYSGEKWGRADNYDLSINSSAVGINGAVELIIEFSDLKLAGSKQASGTVRP